MAQQQNLTPADAAEATAQAKKWTSMTLTSVDIDALLKQIGQTEVAEAVKVEDSTYIENGLHSLRLAKAFDLMGRTDEAYSKTAKAFKTISSLVELRTDQKAPVEYSAIQALFYFKLGDALAAHIELNTDEFGNVKPLTACDDDSDEEEPEVNEEEVKQEEDPNEESKDEPKITEEVQQINTSVQPQANLNPFLKDAKNEGGDGGELLEQEAQEYLSMALQVTDDFINNKKVESEDEKMLRRKLFLFLQIDCLIRRAELAKHVNDLKFAIDDYSQVISLCKEFPENNESTLISAIFGKGKCQMDLQETSNAKSAFVDAQEMLKKQLFSEFLQNGQVVAINQTLPDLIKPSIFDNEKTVQTKQFLVEIQNYVEECVFMEQNKEALDKERAKKKEGQELTEVPEGFGKPQENAESFKTVGFTIKTKKRNLSEMQQVSGENKDTEQEKGGEKRQKVTESI